ncbi:hypothetical protein Acr_00g0022740 [Actinidia rufa]|uniref:Uncharacterized protein n=1 Tax=Actinidia rufa TaxID=165716 RepID=A0A7J0DCM0_9ERIC|nr:hypothetical protein Acr_00g0022740 [Actinidia rufa]
MEFSRRRLSQKGTEGTTVIPSPRGGPRDHGRGYPPSVPSPAVAGFRDKWEKKSGRGKWSPNTGDGEKREKKSGRWPSPGPSPDDKTGCHMAIQDLACMYILRRWSKTIRRSHSKVQIRYEKSTSKVEVCRYDNMCNEFFELAELARDSEERYEKVMANVQGLKREFKEVEVVCESNKYAGTSIENGAVSYGNDHAISNVLYHMEMIMQFQT